MTRISQMAADAGPQGRTSPSVPAIPADRLRAIFETHVVDERPDLFACLDTPAPHRGFAVLIGAACSWLAVFCVAYFAAELIRGLVR